MKRQIIAILFILVMFASVAAVSAADNQSGISDDTYSDYAVVSSGNTFLDISNTIKSTSSSIYYLNNTTYTGGSQISISKSNIIIDGGSVEKPNSMSTLDAEGLSSIFVLYGNNVVLKNLILVNGNTNYRGGAVLDRNGNLTVINCVFINNKAPQGGALYAGSSLSQKVTVENCTFINSSAYNGGGGAIYNYKTNLNVVNCNFSGNTAQVYSGGAIFNYGTLNVHDSTFKNNTGRYGGGILNDETAIASIYNSTFVGNLAYSNSGSAVYAFQGSKLNIYDSDFMSNFANRSGSVVYNYMGNVKINNSNFTDNEVGVSGTLFNDGGNMDVNATIFSGNIGNSGTVVYNTNNGILSIDSSVSDFNVPINGTEIYNEANLKLSNSNLTGECTILQNKGTLALTKNNFDSGNYLDIYNQGTITTPTELIIMDNSTVRAYINQNVTLSGIIYDDNGNVIGEPTLELGNPMVSFVADNGEINPTLLKNGTYVSTAAFPESGLYAVTANVSGLKDLTVKNGAVDVLPQPNLGLDVANITYGQNTTLKIDSPVENVTVVIKADDGSIIYNSTIPVGDLSLDNLDAGNYSVTVSFDGDENYSPTSNTTAFEVYKANRSVPVTVTNVTYGDFPEITVISASPVIVSIDGNNYTVTGNMAVSDLLDAGNYTANVLLEGNKNYNPYTTTVNFTVFKADPSLNVDVSDAVYGGIANGNVVVSGINNSALNGNVNVIVKNKDDAVVRNLTVPVGDLNLADLDAGNYTVDATFAGDGNYNPVSNSAAFEVSKSDRVIPVAISNVTYGDFPEVTVGSNDHVIITVNGVNYNLTNGDVISDLLDAGNYSATVLVEGDKNYNPYTTIVDFSVFKADPSLNVDVSDAVYGGIANGTVSVSGISGSALAGDVTVVVRDGDNAVVRNLTVPVGDFNLVDLDAGNYTVDATFAGNDNYNPVSNSAAFEVSKADRFVPISISDVTYGDFPEVTVGSNDHVVVSVNGVNYNLTSGMTISDLLDVGNYSATVLVEGDKNYNPYTTIVDFSVFKADPSLNVDVSDAVYGGIANGTVSVSGINGSALAGDVTVIVKDENGAVVRNLTVPVGEFNLADLDAGNYTVDATFAGNGNYNPVSNSAAFEVSKADRTVPVAISNVTYGDFPEVTVGSNVHVIVSVNGVDYNLTSGMTVSDLLNAGNYSATVLVEGDNNYNPYTTTANFTVFKANPHLEISVEDIVYGDVADGTIVLSGIDDSLLNGDVTVIINKNVYRLLRASAISSLGTENVIPVSDGIGKVSFSDLAVGNYDALARYDGNDNYNPVSNATTFAVTPFDITVGNITVPYGEGGAVDITLSSNVNRTVNVTFNNNDYAVECIDGKGIFNVPKDTLPGNYSVVGSFNSIIGSGLVTVLNETGSNITSNTTNSTEDVNDNVTDLNNTFGNVTGEFNQTNVSNVVKHVQPMSDLKTANPIFVLLLALFLIPFTRKFNK